MRSPSSTLLRKVNNIQYFESSTVSVFLDTHIVFFRPDSIFFGEKWPYPNDLSTLDDNKITFDMNFAFRG